MSATAGLQRLDPRVLATTSHGFSLGSDLDHLAAVLAVRAPEATIFYGGRILEALSGAAVEQVGGEAKPNPFANMKYLEDLALLKKDQGYWAHGLRRLGNEVRHLHRPVGFGEAEVAALLVERWMVWYFEIFAAGPRLASLFRAEAVADGPLFPPEDPEIARLIRQIDRPGGLAELAARPLAAAEVAALERAPTAACLLAEKWIDAGLLEAAERLFALLDKTIAGELRLLQLKAVACNRRRDPEGSIALLQPVASAGAVDEETLGILAGAYKRRWDRSRGTPREDGKALEQSHRYYDRAWQNSKQASYYNGINAATTALFLGKPDKAREIAALVVEVILKQARQVQERTGRDLLAENYWLAATLAEARLLEGDDRAAARSYEQAFVTFATERGSFATTAQQARAIIRTRGAPAPDLGAVLDRFAPEAGPAPA
jgi:hypothetical protein